MSGFEAYKDNGSIQFISNRGTLPLYQKQNLNVDTNNFGNTPSLYLPYELSPNKTPIIAIKPPTNSNGGVKNWEWIWNDQEAAQAGNRGGATMLFPAAYNTNGAAYQAFIFSNNRNIYGSNFGIQYFDEGGGLVYDMQDRPFRVIDVFECTTWNGTNTSWTENHTYDSSRSYAIVQTNLNRSDYYAYSSRYYDSDAKQYVYVYVSSGYVQAWRPIAGGFQFFNMPAGGGNSYESEGNQVSNFWNTSPNGQRHMIIDVTGF